MIFKRSLQQLLRSPRLVLLYGLALILLTAMLSIGLVLMATSSDLAQQAEDAYTTIGVVEFFQDVPTDSSYYQLKYQLEQGILSEAEYLRKHEEYLDWKAQGIEASEYRYPLEDGVLSLRTAETAEIADQADRYNLAPLADSPYVLDYENRARYGAYSPDIESSTTRDIHTALSNYDILIFTYTGTETLVLDYDFCMEEIDTNSFSAATHDIPVKILWSYLAERYQADEFLAETMLPIQFALLEYDRETLGVLEPGKTYIAACTIAPGMVEWADTEYTRRVSMPLFFDGVYRERSVNSKGTWSEGINTLSTSDTIFLCEYTEDFWNTDTGRQMEAFRRTLDVNYHSVSVMTSRDLNLLQAFHNEELYARQGRLFTEEEYAQSGQVCLVNYDMAQAAGWQVGDKVDLSFYQCDTFSSYSKAMIYTNNFTPTYHGQDFFSTQTYEIVGLYDGPALAAGETIKLKYDDNGKVIDPGLPPYLLTTNLIFIPDGSAQNAPVHRPASFLTTTIRLQNGTAEQYLNDLEQKGLLEPNQDGVRVEITFYDQGYYYAAQLTESTGSAAKTIIALAAATALVSIVLFSYLYVSRRRNEMAILRVLGIPSRRIGAALLLCLLLITAVSVILGCGLGACAADLAEGLFLRDADAQINVLFSSVYGQGIDKSAGLTLSPSAVPFALSAGLILTLVTVTVTLMLLSELRKSPLTLLSKKGERP